MLNVESRFMIKDLYRKGVTISEITHSSGVTCQFPNPNRGGR